MPNSAMMEREGGGIYYMKSKVVESNFQTQTYYFWGGGV